MKSVVLCEGPDDLWFIGYYLNKCRNWECGRSPDTPDKSIWKYYQVPLLSRRQKVIYLKNGTDSVAIWCVAGKDSFQKAVDTILKKINASYSFDPIESLVIFTDRDEDLIEERLEAMQSWLPESLKLKNHETTSYTYTVDESELHMQITPVLVPFSEEGAIETLLMESIQEKSDAGRIIVTAAKEYISSLHDDTTVSKEYLNHDRLILKAKFSATIAATSPDHSTGQFQELVMTCPWECSEYVSTHLNVVLSAISSDQQ